MRAVIDTPDWGPDILIKILPDLDVAFFNGLLRNKIQVSWKFQLISKEYLEDNLATYFQHPENHKMLFQRTLGSNFIDLGKDEKWLKDVLKMKETEFNAMRAQPTLTTANANLTTTADTALDSRVPDGSFHGVRT